ncbi:hypothetical protein [Actinomadura sp. 3N508]|uniref:hypothetical protein n=1 Tax=Actinomadura sp. 3N508 TaxID=3375153 RepID=UPI003797323C
MSFEPRSDGRGADRDLDGDTAEDLLSGRWRDSRAAAHPVAGLLAAAAAPPLDRELAGEEAAVAAFRDAQIAGQRRRGRGRPARQALMRIVTAKAVVALALTGTAAGGVALAAGTGHLPVLEPPSRTRPSASATTVTKTTPAPEQGHRSPTTVGPDRGSPNSPTLGDLCHSYMASGKSRRNGKPTPSGSDPAFARLVAAAGSPDKVNGYCAKLLSGKGPEHKRTGPPTGGPQKPNKPEKEEKGKPGKEKPGKPEKPDKPEKPKKSKKSSKE